MIFGWDGASYQGLPDVARLLREGHVFVIEKVTGEGNYVNPFYPLVRAAAHATGVLFGGYDWVEPQRMASEADGVWYARDYLRVLQPRAGELPPVVDFEEPDWHTGPLERDIEAAMKAYLYALRDEGGAGKVIVYTAPYFLEETGASAWAWLCEANGFYLWQAAPGAGMMADDSFWPATPLPFHQTTIHQHQWHATSDAVIGEFDRNRFRGTIEELRALGLPVAQPPAPTQEAGEVKEPAAGKWTAYINDAGEPIVVLNFGGKTGRIDGVRIADVGVSVESATEPGAIVDRSFQNEAAQPWHDRKGQ